MTNKTMSLQLLAKLFYILLIVFGLGVIFFGNFTFKRFQVYDGSRTPQPNFGSGIGGAHSDVEYKLQTVLLDVRSNNLSPRKLLAIKAKIKSILDELKSSLSNYESSIESSKTNKAVLDVCPEFYNGSKPGYPFWVHNGHITVPCDYAKPLRDVITILLYFEKTSKYVDDSLFYVLDGIRAFYPELKVVLAHDSISKDQQSLIAQYKNVEFVALSPNASKLKIFKEAIKRIKTPYLLVAKNLFHFDNFANLERHIRVLSEDKGLAAVSGAFRDEDAMWKKGCYQMETKMHHLKRIEGYYESINECLYCDLLTGPFVTRTSILIDVPFDVSMESHFMFIDWFLKLKEKRYKTMSCPDSMFYMSVKGHQATESNRKMWSPLATKWQFDVITWNRETKMKYTCPEINYRCEQMSTRNFILPTCCFDEMAKSLKFWVGFAKKYNISYELSTGSVLATVKLADMMPWDMDGDIAVRSSLHSKVAEHKIEFARNRIQTSQWKKATCCSKEGNLKGGYFKMGSPLYFEMFGWSELSTEKFLHPRFKGAYTKVLLHGIVVNGPVNPGLFARNRYGVECYKHAQSWILYGHKDSHVPYKAGEFTKCSRPGFHACLDQHPADGNIPFRIDS